jgi:hypothetical protein
MAVVFACLTLFGCGDDSTGPETAATISLSAGNDQVATVGDWLAQPLVVVVTNSDGRGVSGVTVSWSVVDGTGSLSASSSETDADGLASIEWRMGTEATTGNTIAATVDDLSGSPVSFTATSRPDAAATLTKIGGDGQTGPAGLTLPIPHSVLAADQYGNPVPGVTVGWSAQVGGGSVAPDFSTTGADGIATSERTLGPSTGLQSTTSFLPDVSTAVVTFMATATGVASSAFRVADVQQR